MGKVCCAWGRQTKNCLIFGGAFPCRQLGGYILCRKPSLSCLVPLWKQLAMLFGQRKKQKKLKAFYARAGVRSTQNQRERERERAVNCALASLSLLFIHKATLHFSKLNHLPFPTLCILSHANLLSLPSHRFKNKTTGRNSNEMGRTNAIRKLFRYRVQFCNRRLHGFLPHGCSRHKIYRLRGSHLPLSQFHPRKWDVLQRCLIRRLRLLARSPPSPPPTRSPHPTKQTNKQKDTTTVPSTPSTNQETPAHRAKPTETHAPITCAQDAQPPNTTIAPIKTPDALVLQLQVM